MGYCAPQVDAAEGSPWAGVCLCADGCTPPPLHGLSSPHTSREASANRIHSDVNSAHSSHAIFAPIVVSACDISCSQLRLCDWHSCGQHCIGNRSIVHTPAWSFASVYAVVHRVANHGTHLAYPTREVGMPDECTTRLVGRTLFCSHTHTHCTISINFMSIDQCDTIGARRTCF
jgi:hypothetical protein